jgi:hypothetical protein
MSSISCQFSYKKTNELLALNYINYSVIEIHPSPTPTPTITVTPTQTPTHTPTPTPTRSPIPQVDFDLLANSTFSLKDKNNGGILTPLRSYTDPSTVSNSPWQILGPNNLLLNLVNVSNVFFTSEAYALFTFTVPSPKRLTVTGLNFHSYVWCDVTSIFSTYYHFGDGSGNIDQDTTITNNFPILLYPHNTYTLGVTVYFYNFIDATYSANIHFNFSPQ